MMEKQSVRLVVFPAVGDEISQRPRVEEFNDVETALKVAAALWIIGGLYCFVETDSTDFSFDPYSVAKIKLRAEDFIWWK